MKKNKFLLAISALLLSSGLLMGSASEANPKSDNDGGVFICEDTGEQGPIFYPAEYSTEIADEPSYSTQNEYTFSTLGFENAHKFYRGDSVKVAVIDSGLNYTHEDFEDSNGNQIIQETSRTIDNTSGSWLYYQFNSGYQSKIVDSLGHGTNVASVIASQINALGCAGIAPNVELYVYKVTNTSNGYEWTAINSALSYCIEEGIDVINMSFQAYEHEVTYNGSTMPASTGCSSVMTSYINNCYNAGITLVAAAGNYNTSEPSYPASYNHVISVGSLAESSTYIKAGYSNTYGIDLVAPGTVHVADKGTNNSYKKTNGTSFSAPIVTAAIALYKQQNPTATPSQIESALYASCDTVSGSPSWAGNGRLNIDKFLGTQSIGPTDIVVNNPEVVNDELELEVGDTLDLDWTVNGVGTFDHSVTFSIDSGTNDVVSVTSTGKITANGEGEDLIYITSTIDDSVCALIDVTVTSSSSQEGPDPATDSTQYSLINSTDDLEAGYSYIITNGTSGSVKAISTESNTNNRKTTNVTVSNNLITRGSSVMSFTLGGTTDAWTFATENYAGTDGYLASAASGNNNYLRVISTTANATISFSGDAAVINIGPHTSRTKIQYNANNGNPIFACYSNSQSAIYLWKQASDTPTPSPTLSSIAVETAPTKTTYTAGEYFDPTGLVIRRNFSDSNHDTYTYSGHTSEFTFSPSTSTALTTSNVSVSITYGGKSTTQAITVNAAAKTLSSISLSGTYTTTFNVGDTFSHNGVVVTAHYSDSTSAVVTNSATFTTPDMSTAGNKTVTVSYTEGTTKTTTYSITVNSTEPTGDLTYTIGWGTATGTAGTYSNFSATSGSVTGILSFDSRKNNSTNNPAYNSTSSELRLYYNSNGNGGSIVITPASGITITGFVMSTSTSPTVQYSVNGGTKTSPTKSGSTYSASSLSVTNSLEIQNVNTTNTQLRILTIELSYVEATPTLTGISVHTEPTKRSYTAGDLFDPTGLIITRIYSNSSTDQYTYAGHTSEFSFNPSLETALITTNTSVLITYGEKTTSQTITVNSAPVTSISAVPNKTFYVGETISKSDITVTDNNGSSVSDFTFSNYQFTYSDAASGGSLTQKVFNNAIVSGNLSCSLTVQVQRKARTDAYSDYSIVATDLPTAYDTSVSSRTAASGISFIAYNCAHYSSSGKLQFKSNAGYLRNYSELTLSTVTINTPTGNGTLSVYGGTSSSSISTKITGVSNVYDLSGYTFFKVSETGGSAAYCVSVIVRAAGSETPENVANYIMYEDTNNQCTTKFATAKGYFENMTKDGRVTFMTSDDYVISTARERLLAWAAHEGKTISASGEDYVISKNPVLNVFETVTGNAGTVIAAIAAIIGLSAVGGYFFIRRRKVQ